jgi:protein phosphatase
LSHEYTSLHLIAAGHSDPGLRRELNEDAWRIAEPNVTGDLWEERGCLFAVADGMGGHAAGEVASKLAIETLFAEYYGPGDYPMPPAMRLEQAIAVANGRIYEQAGTKSSQAGMGTTIVAAVVRDDWLIVANVGDSRAYLMRNGQVSQITTDHSWVAEQVEAGLLTQEEAEGHMYRSVVTRCLGHHPEAQVDTFEHALEAGDTVLLCSDGLSNQVSDLELAQILGRYPLERAANELIELANRYGGPDNITAVLLQAQALPAEPMEETPAEEPAQAALIELPSTPADEADRALAPERGTRRHVRWVIPVALVLVAVCATGAGFALWGSGDVRDWLARPTPTVPPTPTHTATAPPTMTPAPTSTSTPSATSTPIPTPTPTQTASATAPPTATPSPTPTPTPTLTPAPTRTPLPTGGPQLVQ